MKRAIIRLHRCKDDTDSDNNLLVVMERQPKRGDWNWIPKEYSRFKKIINK